MEYGKLFIPYLTVYIVANDSDAGMKTGSWFQITHGRGHLEVFVLTHMVLDSKGGLEQRMTTVAREENSDNN